MESSMKYEKFIPSDQEELKKPRSKSPYTKWLIVLAVACVFLLVVCALAIGFGVGFSVSTQVMTGLKDVMVTNDELQGEYHTANGGIYFQTMLNTTHAYFLIKTANGDVVLMFIHPLDTSMTMMVVNNTDFLMIEGEDGAENEYLIPEEYKDAMGSVMMGQAEMTDEMLQQFNTETVATVRESTLQNFAVSPEAFLVIEAAKALGDRGIMGTDSQAVLKFYRFALRLANNRYQMLDQTDYETVTTSSGLSRRRSVKCSSNDAICASNKCPYSSGSNNCFGMCGLGCTCWSFVCGDCCVHTYCETHDECCAQSGFFSLGCFSVAIDVFSSSCDDAYDC